MERAPTSTPEQRSRRAHWGLLVAALIITLLGCELALRRWWPQYRSFTQSSALGWAHLPQITFQYVRREFSTPVSFNAFGLRDDAIPLPKPHGHLRVLCLGDSFTAGLEVPREATWVEHVERGLNRMFRGDPTVETINAGVQGYGAEQLAMFMDQRGWALQPDVLLVLEMGFVERPLQDGLVRLNDGQLVFESRRVDRWIRGWAWLRYHVRLLSWMRHVRDLLMHPTHNTPDIHDRHAPSSETLTMHRALLQHLRDACQARGVQLLVVLGSVRSESLQPICAETGVACLALGASLEALHQQQALTYPLDGHWNALGHATVAEQLIPWLRSQLQSHLTP